MKNKLTKRAIALLCASTAFAGVCGMSACTKKVSDTDQTLEVFCWDAGYGVAWCDALLNEFKKESWVKEKYPNLEIIYSHDGNSNTYTTKIDAGEKANTVDLFFTGGIDKYLGKDASGYEYFADLTQTVYTQKVPGENVTVKDKMLPTYVDSMRFYAQDEDSNDPSVAFKSYVFPWASGMNSILYNANHLAELEAEVPLTTNQFIELCQDISDGQTFEYNRKENGDYAILRDAGGAYWEYLYPTWWGQYEGASEYRNFFNGVVDGERSANVFKQKGKLHALEVMETVLDYENGYVYKKNSGLDFMQAQTNFLKGEGVFYANGDWFSKEMESTAAQIKEKYGIEYEIRMMKAPVVSAIVNRTSFKDAENAEEILREIIRCIDGGSATLATATQNPDNNVELIAGVTEADYAIILEARSIVHAIGPNHQAGVPSYAKGKEVAFDFLRYMATDKAQEIYLKETGGASLPFDYNLEEENAALYAELFEGEGKKIYQVEKDRLNYTYNQCYQTKVLPDPDSFPLVRNGNMAATYSLGGHSTVAFFSNAGASGTAQQVWEDDITYYITNGGFNTCLDRAGLR